jgi:hypothetical protein
MNANQQYHEENMRKANAQVLNTYKEAKMRDYNKLKNYLPPRLIGTQRGITMFYTNPQKNYDCDEVKGSGNITYSARMNADEYEKYRKQTLQRRVDSLQAMKEEGGPVPPMVELSRDEGDKLGGQLTLDSITAQIIEGDLRDVLGNIFKYMQYLVKNIIFFDENDFVKLISIFENLYFTVKTRFEGFRIKESTRANSAKLIYGKETAFLIMNIVNYLRENMKGFGSDIKRRQMLAKSTVGLLRLTDFEKTMRARADSKIILDQIRRDATPAPSLNPLANENLKGLLNREISAPLAR